jgi:hypothetical protein
VRIARVRVLRRAQGDFRFVADAVSKLADGKMVLVYF